jgi:hypothetical protein
MTFALVWAAFGVAFALLFPFLQWTDEPSTVLFAPVFFGMAYAAFRWARGAWRAEVLLLPEEVVVRGPWRTQHYPLTKVAGFTHGLQPAGGMNPTPGVLLKLTDGSIVPVWTLASGGFVWNNDRNAQKWASTAERLNRAVDERRLSLPPSPATSIGRVL